MSQLFPPIFIQVSPWDGMQGEEKVRLFVRLPLALLCLDLTF